MRRCWFCDDRYIASNASGPAEDCLCGANMSRGDARELKEEDYAKHKTYADALRRGETKEQARAHVLDE